MPTQEGSIRPRRVSGMESFDFEVYDGVRWVTLNDHIHYYVGAESLGTSQQGRRRYTVQSSMYDGDWEVHSTANSVTESVSVHITGVDQIDVSDSLLQLEEIFVQPVYNIRVTRDSVRETWTCYPAEWSIDRGQVQSHNVRAVMTLSIPRFPKKTYQAVV
jgi:hypothetical protein